MTDADLPLLKAQDRGSLRGDGSRRFVYPADTRGRFTTARNITFYALTALLVALPLVERKGHPAVLFDIQHRQFFLFGLSFNAQDTWLLFFFLTGGTFGLVFLTAVVGRSWCGWACPQTVFLEGFFRRVERLIQGPREKRMRRNQGGWTVDRIWRAALTHLIYLVLAFLLAHVFLAYFVPAKSLLGMLSGPPAEHPEAFAWAASLTVVGYVNFSWFREQFCVIVCPYGRLQSVLVDADSLVVGYDARRGEPRGKAKNPAAGDCVDCKRCVVVCPTGIDIREGNQLDCLACTQCIDACDEVMGKLGRPRGLVRIDSLNGLEGRPRRFWRPRIVGYLLLTVVGLVVASMAFGSRTSFEANFLRQKGGELFVVEQGTVRNLFEVHLVNKRSSTETFTIAKEPDTRGNVIIAMPKVTLGPLENAHVPVFITVPQSEFRGEFPIRLRIAREGSDEAKQVTAAFLGTAR